MKACSVIPPTPASSSPAAPADFAIQVGMNHAPTPAGDPAEPAATQVVVMGVSGAGKSTIGALVADALDFPFVDADSLHPQANIRKMAAGTPLSDDDRWPWLELVGHELARAQAPGMVMACSALKRSYRDAIRRQAPHAVFLHLDGSLEVLGARLEGRSGHFMPPALLASQLAALEPLEGDESAVVVDVDAGINQIVERAVAGIRAVVA